MDVKQQILYQEQFFKAPTMDRLYYNQNQIDFINYSNSLPFPASAQLAMQLSRALSL